PARHVGAQVTPVVEAAHDVGVAVDERVPGEQLFLWSCLTGCDPPVDASQPITGLERSNVIQLASGATTTSVVRSDDARWARGQRTSRERGIHRREYLGGERRARDRTDVIEAI